MEERRTLSSLKGTIHTGVFGTQVHKHKQKTRCGSSSSLQFYEKINTEQRRGKKTQKENKTRGAVRDGERS